jgi:integrase
MKSWTDLSIAKAKLGRHRLAPNFFLLVEKLPSGRITRKFAFHYTKNGRGHGMGLGLAHDGVRTVNKFDDVIADVYEMKRRLAREPDYDPMIERRVQRGGGSGKETQEATFSWCCYEYKRLNEAGWATRTTQLWIRSLGGHEKLGEDKKPQPPTKGSALDLFGKKLVHQVTTRHVLDVLEPLWKGGKFETAAKLRTRIESVLSWAAVTVLQDPDRQNPARLKGNIEHAIPKRPDDSKTKNHAALPYAQIPGLMAQLSDPPTIGSFALRFLILTGTRLNETREAVWGEFDLEARLWTIPKDRMKMDRDHQVPLSDEAMAILREVRRLYGENGPERHHAVFVGERDGGFCATINKVLKAINPEVTVHGMRSTFRDWCGDCTSFPREIAEAALAHIVKGVEGDYRRSSALEKRRELMAAWADYCASRPKGEVVRLRA